jgi:hypothetical protein
MIPEYADYFHIILDCLHLEELIRLRRRVEKRGHAGLADYISAQIKRRDEMEHEELIRQRTREEK